MMVDVKGTEVDQPNLTYEGVQIFGVDKDGKANMFWFDNWGMDGASMGFGTFSDHTLALNNANATFKEVRTFEIKGKEMVIDTKGAALWQGKETPFDITTVYKKK